MACPNAGVYELEAIEVIVGSRFTVCVNAVDVPAVKLLSPLKVTVME
jgi:hypothetical protein